MTEEYLPPLQAVEYFRAALCSRGHTQRSMSLSGSVSSAWLSSATARRLRVSSGI